MTQWLRLRTWLGRNLLPLLGALFGLALAFLFVSPLLIELAQSLDLLSPDLQGKWFRLLESVHWWSIQAMIVAWVFALGSSIASFLNVVAYRLPRGRSILGRSSCPRCCQQLSIWDNIPIFGWLHNGGRCRTCRLPISLRYLWVELVLGSAFLVIFLADVGAVRVIQALQFSRPEIAVAAIGSVILFFGHALLLSLLFAAALIQWEKSQFPKSFIATGWLMSVAWLCAFQIGIPVGQATQIGSQVRAAQPDLFAGNWLSIGASLLVAIGLGAVLPLGMLRNSKEHPRSWETREWAAFGWIGLFLNWRLTLAASAVAAALILLGRCPRSRRIPPFACVFLAVLFAILCDNWNNTLWTNSSGRLLIILAAGMTAVVIGLSLIARCIGQACPVAEPPFASLDSTESAVEGPIDAISDQPTLRTELNPPSMRID